MMGKDSKNCKLPCHKLFKDQAKNRVEGLLSMVNELQLARKESRAEDVTVLDEQVNQILREWKAELDEPTPATSVREDTLGSFSEELGRLLRQYDVEDDATSLLAEPPAIRHGHVTRSLEMPDASGDKEVYYLNHIPQQHEIQGFENHTPQQNEFQGFEHCNGDTTSMKCSVFNNFEAPLLHNLVGNNLESTTQLDYQYPDPNQNFDNEIFINSTGIEQWGVDGISDFSDLFPNTNPPPSPFLGPNCALWDCTRPALGSKLCEWYCSTFHAELAFKDCFSGTCPVLKAGGVVLKDDPLFAALRSKIESKYVGIPECEGAASAKSPWNAPELFDISLLEQEKIREWLFFDKPRRAFETGNRKQRSLPDHEGRGWHESRKQIMKEFGGLKRSYYADPQPQKNFEWHLFEYEIDNCDTYALYRLERKVSNEKKRTPKKKVANDPLVDLQNRMGRLTAEVAAENKRSGKTKADGNLKSDYGMRSSTRNEIN